MMANGLPRVRLCSSEPAARARWRHDLGANAEIVADSDRAETFADAAIDVVVSDAVFVDLSAGIPGRVFIGEPAGLVPADACLPPDYCARELVQTVCLVAEIVRLRRIQQRDSQRIEQLDDFAHRDALTGLLNRRGWDSSLRKLRPQDLPACLALVDLDHFKLCNDLHGWSASDVVLAGVGAALQASTRSGDAAARWGGDEFALFLCNIPEPAVGETMKRLLRSLLDVNVPEAQQYRVQASIGYAVLAEPHELDHLAAIFAACQSALRIAKSAGGNIAERASWPQPD